MARAATYIALLSIVLAAVSGASGAVATHHFGEGGYLASAVAALIVWIAGSLWLGLVAMATTPNGRLNAVLAGVLLRMAVPLMAVLYFVSSSHPLASKGVAGLIVVHFLVGLTVETLIALRLIGLSNVQGSAGSRNEVPVS